MLCTSITKSTFYQERKVKDMYNDWCKRRLAERLQDLFEQAYEDNQPFATREECIADIEKMLDDEKFIYLILDNLNTIINEYFFMNEKGMPSDAEAKALYSELEIFIKEKYGYENKNK